MLYTIVGMSLLFFVLGFTLTENNAKHLLSGYNTMSEEQRKNVNIKGFVSFFRKFHLILGTFFLIMGLGLVYFVGENAAGIFAAVCPLLAYIYFIAQSSKYFKGKLTLSNKTDVGVLVATLIFVFGLLGYSYKENVLSINPDSIEISGSYGETLASNAIKSMELVPQIPEISSRTNGFSLGAIKKGYFKMANNEKVKLILNSDSKPIILFTKTDGKKIYFAAKDKANQDIFKDLQKTFPSISYEVK